MCDRDGFADEEERAYADRDIDTDADELLAPQNDERCYPDGSLQNECWNPDRD